MTETEEGAGQALYHALKSADGGATWELVGSFRSASRDGALHAAFPETEEGVQYVAVASSFWQPVALQAREVRYVRSVKSLQPVGQLALDGEQDDEQTEDDPEAPLLHGEQLVSDEAEPVPA